MTDPQPSPSRAVITVVSGLIDEAWAVIEPNITGLTASEYLWEPTPDCWSIRRPSELRSPNSWGRGEFVVETSFDGSRQPAITTIAWRLLHAYDCFATTPAERSGTVPSTGTTSRSRGRQRSRRG